MKYKLKDIFDLQMGKTPSRNNIEFWIARDYKWISIADLTKTTKYISETKEYLSKSAVEESKIKVIPANTVVMSFKLSIGKVAITSEDMYSNEAIMAFHDKHIVEILPEYIFYMFKYKNWEEGSNKAVMGKTLNKASLSEIEINITPIEKQKEIVQVLNKMMDIISARENEIKLLDDLIKARFVELFGDVIRNNKEWPIRVFADIASSRLGKMLDAKQQTGKCAYPYLANFNVQWFRFNIENLNQMDFDEDDRSEFELKDGDLLVCEGGEIGRCAVWHNEIQPCFFQKALHRIRCNRQIVHPDYLAWWFRYNCDQAGFAAIAGAKATIAHLPGIKLRQLQVAVPPLELQQQFAAFVTQTDKSKVVVQKALDEAQTLFDSLMQEYFG